MITAKNLTKKYDKQLAVDNLSFEVMPGKVTGFLGPNGAGKSTTMRLMLGLDRGKGATKFDNKSLQEYVNPSRIVGILLEAKAFHPTRTASSHLQVLADEGNIAAIRVAEVLDIVGLKDVAQKRPGKFSLGMSQRLGIAAALLGQPKYLILDEPANGLDPEGMAWLRGFLSDYAGQGNGVFISSHLLSEMSQMVDDVVVIGKGRLIANEPIKHLLSRGSSSVYVRATNLSSLDKALKKARLEFEEQGKGLVVAKATTDDIGKIAHQANVTLLELTPHTATLEDTFLELTADSEEFIGQSEEVKK
jgi:ABC-2 type transport system ATP-binding protein